jgi:hypothetical protein
MGHHILLLKAIDGSFTSFTVQGHCEVQFFKWKGVKNTLPQPRGKKQFAEYLELLLKSPYVPMLPINEFRKFQRYFQN